MNHIQNSINQIIGITAEYNPLHNGHIFHIKQTKKLFPNAALVSVLSANFTQRGLPAFCDKWARTEMALECGIDLVVELPTFFSSHSGMVFAQGAVEILNAVGATHISFGAENCSMLQEASSILTQEPLSFKQAVRKELAEGASYSKAVSIALEAHMNGLGKFASMPNNALAISYISHINRKNYAITPLAIERNGMGHSESATKIRSVLASTTCTDEHFLKFDSLPESTKRILSRCERENRIWRDWEKLFDFVRVVLISHGREELAKIAGMDEGIEGLFLRHIKNAESFDDFIGKCVCARYTRGRLQRQVARILIGIDKWTDIALQRMGPQYIRVLGYNDTGRAVLRNASKRGVKILTKLAGSETKTKILSDIEFRASALWSLLAGSGMKEEKMKPISSCV